MKSVYRIPALLGMSLILWWSCQQPSSTATGEKEASVPADINPNGSSELALMMREMTEYQKRLRSGLADEALPEFPEYFYAISAVNHTSGIIKDKALFNGFVQSWLSSMEALHVAPRSERNTLYKLTVEQCLACHRQHCQGPIPMIQGLY